MTPSSTLLRSFRGAVSACKVLALGVFAAGLSCELGAAQGLGVEGGSGLFVQPGAKYHDHSEVCALVDAWIAADERVERVDLGSTRAGRLVPAFRFRGHLGSTEQSRTVLLVGGLDGRSQAGSEAVLGSAWELLSQLDHLPPDLSFVAIPWGAPDGLARTHGGADQSGRSDTPVDDDGDGFVDEDGPDDIDGDGLALDMVIPDADGGRWCFSEDHRFLVLAGPGDAPRYSLIREGRDDDLDGAFNEDGAGGVDFNAHFPVGWLKRRHKLDHVGEQEIGGAWPLSEPVPRRIADLCLAENIALCISFVGTHGGIDFGFSALRESKAHDAEERSALTVTDEVERRVRLAFERMTGRLHCDGLKENREPRGPSGRLVDWLGSRTACIAMEVAVWGPDVVGVDGRPFQASVQRLGSQIDRSMDALATGRPLGDVDAAWAFWLDDVQGGAGFQDWHPVDLGRGLTGWIGGWEPRTRWNPPEASLGPALEGMARFVAELSLGLPSIELDVLGVTRIGDLVQVDAQVTNRGGLETNIARGAGAGDIVVSLHRVSADDVVAGSAVTRVAALGPDESSRTLRWLIQAKPGAAIQIRARSAATPTVIREVRP